MEPLTFLMPPCHLSPPRISQNRRPSYSIEVCQIFFHLSLSFTPFRVPTNFHSGILKSPCNHCQETGFRKCWVLDIGQKPGFRQISGCFSTSQVSCCSVKLRFILMFRFLFTEIILPLVFWSQCWWINFLGTFCVGVWVCVCVWSVYWYKIIYICVYLFRSVSLLNVEARRWYQYLPQLLSTFLVKSGSPTESGLRGLISLAG